MNLIPAWLQITTSVSTTVGVLIALYVAVWREPRKARREREDRETQAIEDRNRYNDQMAVMQRAEDDRIKAQARKIVPSINRADMFGENLWTARVNNLSNGAVSLLAVRVIAVDADGNDVPDGCRQANNEVEIGQGIERMIAEGLRGAVSGAMQSDPMQALNQMMGMVGGGGGLLPGVQRVGARSPNLGNLTSQQMDRYIAQRLGPDFGDKLREAMIGEMATEWTKTLTPNQQSVMAFKASSADYRLQIVVEFEDEAGYRWERSDSTQPRQIRESPEGRT
ncbi:MULTISPECIES: hypothetical protein [unclassified Mycobacterium]|uniref:hypothetical protein n=1 Tax=unclassified Mycobacterium TaxID=2642494 RepID=UPI000490F6D8|nr:MULTISPECIES: hypothetical protein [unclassified Mycobacterium]SEB26599.1 hypothetical protein SAMN04488580_12131 [Mycobacterium sp. 283mftsu]